MHSKCDLTKYISVETQLQIKKIIFLQKYNNNFKNEIFANIKNNLDSRLENYERINNCNSLYVNCFEIRQINKNDNVQAQECIFNSLPENNLNPFQSFAKLNNLNQKRIIDIKNINSIEEEPDFLFLNQSFF